MIQGKDKAVLQQWLEGSIDGQILVAEPPETQNTLAGRLIKQRVTQRCAMHGGTS